MKNKDQTKEELIDELARPQKRIDKLEKCKIELKRGHQAFRENGETYRSFFETSKDCIFIIHNFVIIDLADRCR